jgi:enamine deaminase RidA (YjgF/YER057c/UK114 family)
MATMSEIMSAGGLLFISGQVAFDGSGAVVGSGDPRTQVEQVFTNMGRLLAEAAADFSHVVKLTAYVTDALVYKDYAEVKARIFRGITPPAATTVIVRGLLHPDLVIEVEAIATRPGDRH